MTDTVEINTSQKPDNPEKLENHSVTITVNNKSVTVTGPRLAGMAIKQAAVAVGVSIGLDFQLAEVRGKGRVIIGDDELVTVNKNSKFFATAPDDNS
jgi:cell division protein ZapA (FtsZ GTPase activity inhibitor)